jgi:carbonic anhydrase
VPNIIVCGHFGCGAISGLLHPEHLENMPNVEDWLRRHAEPVREMMSKAGRLGGPEELPQAVDANVLVQLENLRTHPSVAAALADKTITLHGWVYDIASGEVRAYQDEWKQFAPL